MKKLLSVVLCVAVSLALISGVAIAAEKPSLWAEEQVTAAVAANLVPQFLQSQYTRATTRAEFCALAVALYENIKGEIKDYKIFTDTTDENVGKCAAIGIVNGTNAEGTIFSPDAQLTREQAATMLSRLANTIDKPLEQQTAAFADNGSVSGWATDAIGQMQATGIMEGVGNNTFSPQSEYTREQSIITIVRLYNFVTGATLKPPVVFGTMKNPYPADNNEVLQFQKSNRDNVKTISISVESVIAGESANNIIFSENSLNKKPAFNQEWRIYVVNIKYLSGVENDILNVRDLLISYMMNANREYDSGFLNQKGKEIVVHKTATFNIYKQYNYSEAKLRAGENSIVLYGILTNKDEAIPLIKVPYNSGKDSHWISCDAKVGHSININIEPNQNPSVENIKLFLKANFGKIDTVIGDIDIKNLYTVSEVRSPNLKNTFAYDYKIVIDSSVLSNIGEQHTREQAIQYLRELKEHEQAIGSALIQAYPTLKFEGCYGASWYTYPNLEVDLNTRRYFSWNNYDDELGNVSRNYYNTGASTFRFEERGDSRLTYTFNDGSSLYIPTDLIN